MATVQDPTVIEFDVRTDEMLVNMGPQHPSTHGVLRLVLRTDGEVVSEVIPHLGYLHRCAEKIGENARCVTHMPGRSRVEPSRATAPAGSGSPRASTRAFSWADAAFAPNRSTTTMRERKRRIGAPR